MESGPDDPDPDEGQERQGKWGVVKFVGVCKFV